MNWVMSPTLVAAANLNVNLQKHLHGHTQNNVLPTIWTSFSSHDHRVIKKIRRIIIQNGIQLLGLHVEIIPLAKDS